MLFAIFCVVILLVSLLCYTLSCGPIQLNIESGAITSAYVTCVTCSVRVQSAGLMNWMVRQSTELEVNMNAVERVIEYTKLTPEKPPVIANHRPPKGWPSEGVIEAENLVVRYREDLDPVLKHISFQTQPHEKIGVVGRTGGSASCCC